MTSLFIDGRKIIIKKSESVTKMREEINYVIHVNNLTYDTDENDLKQFFKTNGIEKIKDILIARDEHEKSRGFAFVEFETEDDLNKSLKIQSKKIKQRPIVIKISKRNISKNTTDESSEGKKKDRDFHKDKDRESKEGFVGRKRKLDINENKNTYYENKNE